MALPAITAEKDVKLLLKRLLDDGEESCKFAVVARGPKDGELLLSKNARLKRKDVLADAQARDKGAKLEVMSGECRLHAAGGSVLRLLVHGRAIAKAVACVEHLLVRGPYKTVGFTDVILTEVEEDAEQDADSSMPASERTPSASESAGDETPEQHFKRRLAALLPALKAAAGQSGADTAKLRASEAGTLARKQDFAAAEALLDQAAALLAGQVSAATAVPSPPPAAPRHAPATSFVDYARTRLQWEATRKQVQAELRKLEQAILEQCKDEPDFADIAAGTRNLYVTLEFLDARLGDKLDEALNAPSPALRAARHDEAREIVDEYIDYIDSEPLFEDIDDNGFTTITIASTLTASLAAIGRELRVGGDA